MVVSIVRSTSILLGLVIDLEVAGKRDDIREGVQQHVDGKVALGGCEQEEGRVVGTPPCDELRADLLVRMHIAAVGDEDPLPVRRVRFGVEQRRAGRGAVEVVRDVAQAVDVVAGGHTHKRDIEDGNGIVRVAFEHELVEEWCVVVEEEGDVGVVRQTFERESVEECFVVLEEAAVALGQRFAELGLGSVLGEGRGERIFETPQLLP
jgi:hypothetical protein